MIGLGNGTGAITSSPAGISCSGTVCTGTFENGNTVTLTATPSANSRFAKWSDGTPCWGGTSNTCIIPINSDKTVTATFTLTSPADRQLTVSKTGPGTVISYALDIMPHTDGKIFCGAACTATYPQGTAMRLNAEPNSGATFSSWGGDCSGTSPICYLTIDSAKTVTAAFNAPVGPTNVVLTVTKGGAGNGAITSSDGKINCGSSCTGTFANGTSVTLNAVVDSESKFFAWVGCTPSRTDPTACTLTLNSDKTVNGQFDESRPCDISNMTVTFIPGMPNPSQLVQWVVSGLLHCEGKKVRLYGPV